MKNLLMHAALLGLTVAISGCNNEEQVEASKTVRPVKLLDVIDFDATNIRRFPAKTAATKQVDLAFRIPGQLMEFNLVEGQFVQKNTMLARLDDRDAKNVVLNNEANYDLALADFQRRGELLRQNLISQADYDASQAKLKSTRAALANARDQLSYTALKAPYSGTIAKINIDNFQMVQANQSLLVLQKDSYIDVIIQVPESLINSITQTKAKHQAKVRFSAKPAVAYPVTLKEYASQVTSGTQSYEVVFTLPQPSAHKVLPGMSAELAIDVSPTTSTINTTILPANAITKRDSDGKNIVWLYNPNKGEVSQQIVTLGNVSTQGVEVISGLQIGDKVVVAGIQYMSPGLTVKPLHWQRGV